MIVLSAPKPLESVKKLSVQMSPDDETFNHFSKQFLPTIRLHSPWIEIDCRQGEESVLKINDEERIEVVGRTIHDLCQAILDFDRGFQKR